MRHVIAPCLCLCLLATPLAARAAAPAAEWPVTPAGELARGWMTAYNGGEDAMRAFLSGRMTERALRERAVPARLERYRSLREKYGRLQFDRVVRAEPRELTVQLLDADAKRSEWVFTIEAGASPKLASVAIRERRGHGGFGGFHH